MDSSLPVETQLNLALLVIDLQRRLGIGCKLRDLCRSRIGMENDLALCRIDRPQDDGPRLRPTIEIGRRQHGMMKAVPAIRHAALEQTPGLRQGRGKIVGERERLI